MSLIEAIRAFGFLATALHVINTEAPLLLAVATGCVVLGYITPNPVSRIARMIALAIFIALTATFGFFVAVHPALRNIVIALGSAIMVARLAFQLFAAPRDSDNEPRRRRSHRTDPDDIDDA